MHYKGEFQAFILASIIPPPTIHLPSIPPSIHHPSSITHHPPIHRPSSIHPPIHRPSSVLPSFIPRSIHPSTIHPPLHPTTHHPCIRSSLHSSTIHPLIIPHSFLNVRGTAHHPGCWSKAGNNTEVSTGRTKGHRQLRRPRGVWWAGGYHPVGTGMVQSLRRTF